LFASPTGLDDSALACPRVPQHDTETIDVLHLTHGEHYAGAERILDHLAIRLLEFGYRVQFACIKPGDGVFQRSRASVDTPLFDVPMRHRLDFRVAEPLAAHVRDHGLALVHAHTPRTAMIGSVVARRAGVPLVYHVLSPAKGDTTRRWFDRINGLVERRCLRDAAALVPCSESLARYARDQGYLAERISVVPNGVPIVEDIFERDPPRGTWTLGMTALIRPRKGIEVLLAALAQLLRRDRDVRLRVVGGFEQAGYERRVKRLAEQLGVADRVDWIGFTNDVASELRKMDLFIVPSLFGEGLPMVLLEAMAAGIPPIATDVEGAPEAVRDGKDGLIVPPGDASSLADAVDRFLTGSVDWSDVRISTLARQRDRYSDTAMAAGIAAVYHRVLSPQR
jgi:glycosyltransferase involved in cell wall biosynthesis